MTRRQYRRKFRQYIREQFERREAFLSFNLGESGREYFNKVVVPYWQTQATSPG